MPDKQNSDKRFHLSGMFFGITLSAKRKRKISTGTK
jgi:hypothetical protein